MKSCLNNQVLVPDFDTNTMVCIDVDVADFKCPGAFNLYCKDNDIGTDFDSSMCDCDGQLMVSADCKESFYCYSRLSGGGASIKCDGFGQIVDLDFVNMRWSCSDNTNNCPSNMGGFQLGCENSQLPAPLPKCELTTNPNPNGMCDCDGQVWVNEDCSQGFYCSSLTQESEQTGCELICGDNERLHVDLVERDWECLSRDDDFVCPGSLHTDCDENPVIECECQNQVWVYKNCNQAFRCTGPMDNFVNPGYNYACPEGYRMDIDFHYPLSFQCKTDVENCPGSYHFGCTGDIPDLSTSTTIDPSDSTTTTDPSDSTTTTDPSDTTTTADPSDTTTTTDPSDTTTTPDPSDTTTTGDSVDTTTTTTTKPDETSTTTSGSADTTTMTSTTPPGGAAVTQVAGITCILVSLILNIACL